MNKDQSQCMANGKQINGRKIICHQKINLINSIYCKTHDIIFTKNTIQCLNKKIQPPPPQLLIRRKFNSVKDLKLKFTDSNIIKPNIINKPIDYKIITKIISGLIIKNEKINGFMVETISISKENICVELNKIIWKNVGTKEYIFGMIDYEKMEHVLKSKMIDLFLLIIGTEFGRYYMDIRDEIDNIIKILNNRLTDELKTILLNKLKFEIGIY